MGPTWVLSVPGGSHVGPMNLAIWVAIRYNGYWPLRINGSLLSTSKHYNSLTHLILTWWRHKWKNVPRYWLFVRGIHRSPVDFPHKGQWRVTLMFSLICAWTNFCTSNRDTGDLKNHRPRYDVTVILTYLEINSARRELIRNTTQVTHTSQGLQVLPDPVPNRRVRVCYTI